MGAGHHRIEGRENAGVFQLLTGQAERRTGRDQGGLALVILSAGDHLPLQQLGNTLELGVGQVIAGLAITQAQALVGVIQAGNQLTAFHRLSLQHVEGLQLAADTERQLGLLGGLQARGEFAQARPGRVFHGKEFDQARGLFLGGWSLIAGT